MNLLAVKLSTEPLSESLHCQRRESQLSQDKVCEITGVIPPTVGFLVCLDMFCISMILYVCLHKHVHMS